MSVTQEDIDRAVRMCAEAGHDAQTCGRTIISKVCEVSEKRARNIQTALRGGVVPASSAGGEPPKNSREDEFTENTWVIRMNSDRVKNYDEMVAACSVDLNIWEPERFKVKSYEVTYVPRATRSRGKAKWVRPSSKAVTVPMFAITASFIKKAVKALQGKSSNVEFLKQFKEVLSADTEFVFNPQVLNQAVTVLDPGHSEIVVVPSSDLHLAETVRPEDANGINFYNTVVAANRLWEHAQTAKHIIGIHRSVYNIEKIWSPLLGDVTNGTIHQEYVATNDLTDAAAVILGARLMGMFYKELATLGIPIEIDAVHGNHPRLTPKMPTKNQAHTNLDWQLYEMLADRFTGNDQIKLDICTSQIGRKKLYDWTYLFEHGISVKRRDIDGFEDHLRSLFDDPVYREATGNQGAAFDQAVIGNLHTPMLHALSVVNGSYIGQNELGQSWRLAPIRAQQLMWGVSRRHVRTWNYAVELTHIKHERPDNPFSDYAAWFVKRHGNH